MSLKSFFLVTFIFCYGFSIKSQNKPFLLNDTLFISRDVDTLDYYHAIYIDSNTTTEEYKWLLGFSIKKDYLELSLKNESADTKKKKSDTLKINRLDTNLIGVYIPLYQFQGKYYLYAPSDWGNSGERIIPDSSLIHEYMDGPSSELISSVTKKNDTYIVKTYYSFESTDVKTLKITCIDKEKGLYLWDDDSEAEQFRYHLFVNQDKAKNFPMIVNYCKSQKQMEFKFDELDVEKLLNH